MRNPNRIPLFVFCALAASVFGASALSQGLQPTIVINELMAENDSTLKDKDGAFSDWIELFNYGTVPQSLTDCFLTDNKKTLKKWRIPNLKIQACTYQLIFMSGKDSDAPKRELHTNFRLRAKGDYLALVARDGVTVIHAYDPKFPKQKKDISYGLAKGWRAAPDSRDDYRCFFIVPTPGKANDAPMLGEVKPIQLSHKRGFYNQPFDLEVTSKSTDAEIRYTLDGSVPSANHGTLYQIPIRIEHTTVLRVVAFLPGYRPSKIKTVTFLFPHDVIRQSPEGLPPVGFPNTWGSNKLDYGMDPRVVNDPRFAEEIIKGLTSLPSFSIVMNLSHLFDHRNGIYANAQRRGREWERPCSVEMMSADASEGFQIDCGIRIRGGYSRMEMNPKHAFRLFFRDIYGPSKLKYPLFGDAGAGEYDNIDLRTFQNYSWSLHGDRRGIFLRDQFNRELQLAMGQPAARGEFCHLFINGHYWGLYNTCERPEASYASGYFGGKKDDYDVVKKNSGGLGGLAMMATDGNLDAWRQLWEEAKAGLESNEAYFRIQGRNPDGTLNPDYPNLLDVTNLIDYMLVIFYGGNLDAPISQFAGNRWPNNWYGIRNRNGTEGFRFFIWDAEHTLLNVEEDRTGPYPAGQEYGASNPQWLWQQCLDNAEFRLKVADRVHKHFFNSGVLAAESVRKRFLARAREIESAVICESARWGDAFLVRGVRAPWDGKSRARRRGPLNRNDDWRKEIGRISDDYMPQRSDIVLGQLYRHGVIIELKPPRLKRSGGTAPIEFDRADGDIYFTTNGADPRNIGGSISTHAKKAPAPTTPAAGTLVKARTKRDGEWSALTEVRWAN